MIRVLHSPRGSVQRSQTQGADSTQTLVRRPRSRTVDEDPIFLMIYYDNDQFYGEDIYYLCVREGKRAPVN